MFKTGQGYIYKGVEIKPYKYGYAATVEYASETTHKKERATVTAETVAGVMRMIDCY